MTDGGEYSAMFGGETLDPRSDYFNHASVLMSSVFHAGGLINFKKMNISKELLMSLPGAVDNGDGTVTYTPKADTQVTEGVKNGTSVPLTVTPSSKAGLTVYGAIIDDAAFPTYERDAIGKIKLPKVETGTTAGKKVVFLTAEAADAPEALTDVDFDGTTATAYPLFTLESTGENKWYNTQGITIEPVLGNEYNAVVLKKVKTMEFSIGVVSKATGSRKDISNVLGSPVSNFTFKPRQVHPVTNKGMSLTDVFPKNWHNTVDVDLPLLVSSFEEVVLHPELDAFRKELVSTEVQYQKDNGLTAQFNLETISTEEVDLNNLLNWLTFKDVNENEYHTIGLASALTLTPNATVPSLKVADISRETPLYLQKGADGSVDNLDVYEAAVLAEVATYADKDSQVQSTALNQESIFYDSGFRLDTKLKLNQLTFFRRDIIPVMSTQVFKPFDKDGQATATDISYGGLITQAFTLVPESKVYGTSTSRYVLMNGSGYLPSGIYPHRVPLTIDLAYKATKYMGALNGKWNGRWRFTRQPGNIIDQLVDVVPKFIPESIKPKLFKSGIIYPEPDDRVTFFYPALGTGYSDDTSILKSFFTNMVITDLVKINDEAWRKFTGATDLSDLELKREIEGFINQIVQDKYDDQFTIIPEVYYLEADKLRGYSWNLKVTVYGNVMKTTQVSHIETRRASDLDGGN
jgi:hypothetical protein